MDIYFRIPFFLYFLARDKFTKNLFLQGKSLIIKKVFTIGLSADVLRLTANI